MTEALTLIIGWLTVLGLTGSALRFLIVISIKLTDIDRHIVDTKKATNSIIGIVQLHEKRLIDLERYLQDNPLGVGFRKFKERNHIVLDFPDQLDDE